MNDSISIAEQRKAVIAEALTWIGTPFSHQQCLKGVGVDCGYFISKTLEVSLGWPKMDFGDYSPQWALHHDDQANFYVDIVLKYCIEITEPPSTGDLILIQIGRGYSHGGVVFEWPHILHADALNSRKVIREDMSRSPLRLKNRRFFSPKQWHAAKACGKDS